MIEENPTKEEFLSAITTGVKEAIHEMMESGDGNNGPILREPILEAVQSAIYEAISEEIPREDKVFEAISEGVSVAIWKIATNATSAPCGDFYYHVKQGVKEGIEMFHGDINVTSS